MDANAWLDRRIIGIAHQGGAAEGPANTVEAMATARANGAAGLELDVHLSRDERLVLHHDPDLAIAGRRVSIADTDLAELRSIAPDLATLEQVLAAFPDVPLTVEVKAPKAAEPTARLLAAEPGDRPIIVTAFSTATVAAVARAAPRLDTAPGWTTNIGFWLISRVWGSPPLGSGHVALQVPFRLDQVATVRRIPLLRRLRIADRRLVDAAHRRGLAVHVWTLNDAETMRAAIDFGADGILTDRPTLLTATLESTGDYWSR